MSFSSVTSLSSLYEASARVSLYAGLTNNEKTFVAFFIPCWSCIVSAGILCSLLALKVDELAWAAGVVYLISNTGSLTVPKFILLSFRTMNRKLLYFLFILQFFLIIYIVGLIHLIGTLNAQDRHQVVVLFAIAGVINAVTFIPSYVFELYRIKLLRLSQVATVTALVASTQDGKISAQAYQAVYPPPPGMNPVTDTSPKELSDLQVFFSPKMSLEYNVIQGMISLLGVLQVVTVISSVLLESHYIFAVVIYWSLSIIPVITPRYADWTASKDHLGVTQDMQLMSNVSYFLGASSVLLGSGASSTPSWVVTQFGIAGTINGLCYVIMMFFQSGMALYRLHVSADNAGQLLLDSSDDSRLSTSELSPVV